jgi:tRNA threonylcarbamoyladenosine biosynthesis protein TsaB
MLILALDTTTRTGSVALARDGVLVGAYSGDGSRTHAARLPGDILALLGQHGVRLPEIDLYAVAAGPGSFTGLRIGIATIQGLAFANEKPVVAVSALEALAHSLEEAGLKTRSTGEAGLKPCSTGAAVEQGFSPALVGAWIDAQRGEVYAELFAFPSLGVVEPPLVGEPAVACDAWSEHVSRQRGLLLIGDGALAYRAVVEARLPGTIVAPRVPLLAPALARLAAEAAQRGLATPPHAIRPLYVRRPDAELARDRARRANAATPPARPGSDG